MLSHNASRLLGKRIDILPVHSYRGTDQNRFRTSVNIEQTVPRGTRSCFLPILSLGKQPQLIIRRNEGTVPDWPGRTRVGMLLLAFSRPWVKPSKKTQEVELS